jgi:hypothetical protein
MMCALVKNCVVCIGFGIAVVYYNMVGASNLHEVPFFFNGCIVDGSLCYCSENSDFKKGFPAFSKNKT